MGTDQAKMIVKRTVTHGLMVGILMAGALTQVGRAAQIQQQDISPSKAKLQLAIEDLIQSFGDSYLKGSDYLHCLQKLQAGDVKGLRQLQQQALLANPLIDFQRLIVLKRKKGQVGLPTNHQCNFALKQTGYDNELAILSPVHPSGRLTTLFRPPGRRFVGEVDLHYDAERLLFTMPDGTHWSVHELQLNGSGLRQITPDAHPDVDCFDGCYLPNGRIVFASTASYTAVPCWHGKERACSLYLINADGSGMRQLCFDQDLDLHPAVLANGQVIYSRWDYTGIMHMYARPLMVMNPDGTGQRAVYGSNSYWPNCLFFPREVPGQPGKLISIMAGYHNDPRMGQLALLDLAQGWYETEGVVQMIPGRKRDVKPVIKDWLTAHIWPKFLHPWPLSDKYFLVAMQPQENAAWGIYLVDVFDNIVPILTDAAYDFYEPIPLVKRARARVVPERVDLEREDAVVYLHDIYQGPGLTGVPRGTIKALRVASYHYGYPGMAGPDKCGSGGPWEVMRILGTVPLNEDGSVTFRVPACVPLTLQPLDSEGKAVQLMRSWFSAMPGETISCVGCHEAPKDVPAPRVQSAALQRPRDIEPWYGPVRGFDFAREVQPVLDAHCVRCHNGAQQGLPDLRDETHHPHYTGRSLRRLGRKRIHPEVAQALGGTKVRYTPAYEALLPYIRRVNVEDDVRLLTPGEYHADTSELIQMLQKGHQGLRLDAESWDRLITWIDLNGPCHGSWHEVAPVPDRASERRWELAQLYGGPRENPESVPAVLTRKIVSDAAGPLPYADTGRREARAREEGVASGEWLVASKEGVTGEPESRTIELTPGISLTLVKIPAGCFVMGDAHGEVDETPRQVTVPQAFWMGCCEVSNAQYRCFDAQHNSGVYSKRYVSQDGPGLSLNSPNQPALRVAWGRAQAFCDWLSKKSGLRITLPTEAQWEYACRAGTRGPLNYGDLDSDFSEHANLADAALHVAPMGPEGCDTNAELHMGNGVFESALYGSAVPCEACCNDQATVTAPVGQYRPNAWGLYDMHGNVCEWTRSSYTSGTGTSQAHKVVRGGSWVDRPKRSRSAMRLGYPAWQRVFNVGFRVVWESDFSEGGPPVSDVELSRGAMSGRQQRLSK